MFFKRIDPKQVKDTRKLYNIESPVDNDEEVKSENETTENTEQLEEEENEFASIFYAEGDGGLAGASGGEDNGSDGSEEGSSDNSKSESNEGDDDNSDEEEPKNDDDPDENGDDGNDGSGSEEGSEEGENSSEEGGDGSGDGGMAAQDNSDSEDKSKEGESIEDKQKRVELFRNHRKLLTTVKALQDTVVSYIQYTTATDLRHGFNKINKDLIKTEGQIEYALTLDFVGMDLDKIDQIYKILSKKIVFINDTINKMRKQINK